MCMDSSYVQLLVKTKNGIGLVWQFGQFFVIVISSHVLFPTASPIITTHPESQTFKDKETNILTLWIIATGIGPIYYQWQKYDLFSNSWISPSSRAENITSPNLTFTIITEEDEGLYRCIASNDDGDVFSDYANVTVYGKDIRSYTYVLQVKLCGHIDGCYTYLFIYQFLL